LKWAIESAAKAETVSVIGAYWASVQSFPIERVLEKLSRWKPELQSPALHAGDD